MNPRSTFGTILVVIGLIGLYYVFTNDGKPPLEAMKNYFTSEINREKSVDIAGIRNIEVESNNLDVHVVRGNGQQAVLTLQGRASKPIINDLSFDYEKEDDTLHIALKGKTGFQFGFSWSSVKLTVALPEHAWQDLDIVVDSGDIQLDNQQFANVNIQTDSGDIEAKRLAVTDKLELSIDSGDAELEEVSAQTIDLEADSGDITVKDYTAQRIDFSVGSGDVFIGQGTAALHGSTSSGDITVEAEELLYDSELEASSGDVTVELDEDPRSLFVEFEAGSGDGVIRKDGFTYEEGSRGADLIRGSFGDGDIRLQVTTGSGDFVLK
ncbi:DUF4097 family beta strand repeat-containing protein [Paenibacillus soyae]|uniref:DUF4097 domain-containing protein n=1 Tax=Paenibacillus soyae TaxID=2969249 RepID=A0A9X2SD06_9BACL|nr:DUF4097 domain-containing protein [Paenibacillus soyae]MCR2807338.1 DUF4097 domain-containing protein [Paenibacillus soyae]